MQKQKTISPATWWVLGVIILVVIGLFVWGRGGNGSKTFEEKSTREIAMICTTDMATEYHVHPELEIIASGEKEEIPANIGIRAGCMNPLHTHSSDGVIHVESPVKRDFTLGDFFAVWKQPFPENAKITVNGQEVDTGENTILYDKDKIVISF